jgi:hypothetical protein
LGLAHAVGAQILPVARGVENNSGDGGAPATGGSGFVELGIRGCVSRGPVGLGMLGLLIAAAATGKGDQKSERNPDRNS